LQRYPKILFLLFLVYQLHFTSLNKAIMDRSIYSDNIFDEIITIMIKNSLLTLDVTGIDFVHNTNDAEFIINEIQQSWADSKKEKLKKVSSL